MGDRVDPIEGFFAGAWVKAAASAVQGQVGPKAALEELRRTCAEELRRRLGKEPRGRQGPLGGRPQPERGA